MAKTITLQELKPGDIVLYSPPPGKDAWESWLICFFTGSPVSHTAMIDSNPGYAVQEIPGGATVCPLPDPGTRTVYVRRLEGEPDTSEVLKIAMKYVDEKLPYPMSNLVFLGMYILASDFLPNTATGLTIECALKAVCYVLMEFINKHLHPGTSAPPMVCSQFAAACYDEAAITIDPKYKIHYNEDVSTVSNLIHKMIDQLTEEEKEKMYEIEMEEGGLQVGAVAGQNYAEQLAKAIQEQQNSNLITAPGKISEGLIKTFYQYGKCMLKLLKNVDYPDKKQATSEEIINLLKELLAIQEAFISPGDLLSHTTNLMDMGELVYTAEEIAPYWNKNEN